MQLRSIRTVPRRNPGLERFDKLDEERDLDLRIVQRKDYVRSALVTEGRAVAFVDESTSMASFRATESEAFDRPIADRQSRSRQGKVTAGRRDEIARRGRRRAGLHSTRILLDRLTAKKDNPL